MPCRGRRSCRRRRRELRVVGAFPRGPDRRLRRGWPSPCASQRSRRRELHPPGAIRRLRRASVSITRPGAFAEEAHRAGVEGAAAPGPHSARELTHHLRLARRSCRVPPVASRCELLERFYDRERAAYAVSVMHAFAPFESGLMHVPTHVGNVRRATVMTVFGAAAEGRNPSRSRRRAEIVVLFCICRRPIRLYAVLSCRPASSVSKALR